ncbi:hypothetical protein ACVC7V_24605 [Hydrogenophaga sp. A37]|uniref:hypothetical protein n=1 Tax=Hydrogenophaga sp. A37 TaxID=1945864 RepID=UPI0009872430|nr:hypothetical protein [Hydrogenophaga sp. A37]OOG88617.1 hypothetical protein B0E41_01910 [Hydrogenophaga sp. A37]
MLKVPAFRTVAGVTLYADDTLWYRFYPVSDQPRVRLDKDGQPVFLLVKYALSDEELARNPTLPRGGGYLNVDVVFELDDAQREAVRADLQAWVDTEFARRQSGSAEEKASVQGMAAAPPVDFGTPTYTGGTVAMDAPQSSVLVSKRVATGAPSLLADNVSVFSMDLTSEGATFMERTLTGGGGAATASDLTPIQVRYDLTFWARLPPVRIHVKADSQRMYEQVRKIMDGAGVDHCTTYDFQHSDIDTASAEVAGLITVQIDTGSGSLDDAVIAELRRYALEVMQELVESNFFTTDLAEAHQPAGSTDIPDEALSGRRDKTKKYLRQQHDSVRMKLELSLEQNSVVAWPIHPQGTLQTFFRGMSPAQISNFVRVVHLDDPAFQSLNVTARVFAPFDAAGLEAVEVELRYTGRDANGDHQEKLKTFTFTGNQPQKWEPKLIGDERGHEFRYRFKFAGRAFGSFTPWEHSGRSDLNIAVPGAGRVMVEVRAGDVDFENQVRQVQVLLAYEDPAAGVPRQEQTVVLEKTSTSGVYDRQIFEPRARPVLYRQRFRMHSGEVVEDAEWQALSGSQLIVNQPARGLLRVRLLPAGDGWDGVAQVIVDLRYEDAANGLRREESLVFKSSQEFRTWEVALRDQNRRSFEYRINASFKDGRFQQGEWQPHSGEETLAIVVKAPPRHQIQIVPDRLDLATAPLTEVSLTHLPTGRQETFVFRAHTPVVWNVDVDPGTPVRYRVEVTHFPAGGDPVVLAPFEEEDPVLVLPPYQPPRPGLFRVQLVPSLIDFTKTPLVTIDLRYQDEVHGIDVSHAVALTDRTPMEWVVDVRDVNRRLYAHQITYFVAPDQVPHALPQAFTDKPLLVVPRFQP